MVNMTDVSNVTSLQGIAQFSNNAVDGVLFGGGIIVFFFIILLVLSHRGQPFEQALAVASWSMFTISVFFWFAHLLPIVFPLGFLIVASFDVMYLFSSKN